MKFQNNWKEKNKLESEEPRHGALLGLRPGAGPAATNQKKKRNSSDMGRRRVACPVSCMGSALRAKRTGLRDLALGLLTRVHARLLRVHVDAVRDFGRRRGSSNGPRATGRAASHFPFSGSCVVSNI